MDSRLPPDVSAVLARLAQVEGRISIIHVAIAALGDLDRLQVYARELLALGNRLVPELRRSDDWPGNDRAVAVRIFGGRGHLEERGITVRGRHTSRGRLLTFLPMSPDTSFASLASLADDEVNPFEDSILDEARPESRSANGDDDEENPFTDEVLGLAAGETPRSPRASPAPLLVDPALPGENPFEDYEAFLRPGWDKKS